jgi:hypothetical protein
VLSGSTVERKLLKFFLFLLIGIGYVVFSSIGYKQKYRLFYAQVYGLAIDQLLL